MLGMRHCEILSLAGELRAAIDLLPEHFFADETGFTKAHSEDLTADHEQTKQLSGMKLIFKFQN